MNRAFHKKTAGLGLTEPAVLKFDKLQKALVECDQHGLACLDIDGSL